MQAVVAKAFLVGTASLATAVALICGLVTLLDEQFELSMFISAVLGSYGIGSTVSGYLLVQAARHRKALADLADTHHKLSAAHALLFERARRDGMTGLLNRTTFMHELEEFERGAGHGALLVIDADRFKMINDLHGHMAGDAALIAIVGAIRAVVDAGVPAGRLGGEEFGVLLRGIDADAAIAGAEKIRRSVAMADFRPDGRRRLPLSVSIGVEFLSRGWTVEEAVRNADRRLYEAKSAGRNRVIAAAPLSAATAAAA